MLCCVDNEVSSSLFGCSIDFESETFLSPEANICSIGFDDICGSFGDRDWKSVDVIVQYVTNSV